MAPPEPDHHPCSSYLKTIHVPDLKVKPGTCRPRKLHQIPCTEMNALPVKICCVPPPIPPPEPDPCKEQKIRKLLKAGYKLCPKPTPPPPPPPPPKCLAICKERIKNFHPASDSYGPCKYPRYSPDPPC